MAQDFVARIAAVVPDGMSREEVREIAELAWGELETRVGNRLSARLTDAQLREFEAIRDSDDEAASVAFLDKNIPGHEKITVEEMENLLRDVGQRMRGE
ncbi:hypothetical protein GOARA_013_00360 [Gordonia araii NBRC 100433]|uniref:Uncharacterized protein n=1 Tax=Gordonia araii NBRC 100433 TaxID=1073574 RepID=G7GYB7_9ACTN|nr:DUF5663 domain-containing protein [Gordonia araii]NNG97410.1 hypothetical protein [Gordonia araii NBRC 100433]GAB08592.1 hypothetical protein GOARA_013_00360 [Gordonia araii NBRC 100433]